MKKLLPNTFRASNNTYIVQLVMPYRYLINLCLCVYCCCSHLVNENKSCGSASTIILYLLFINYPVGFKILDWSNPEYYFQTRPFGHKVVKLVCDYKYISLQNLNYSEWTTPDENTVNIPQERPALTG